MTESGERAERRARQKELADRLKASGALDGIFEQIDAGQVPLGGDDGLLKAMLKAALERGLEVELTDHVGYERGDPEASLSPNSRNGTTAKTVSSQVGDVGLAVPRDRNGTFTPQLLPKESRRLGGLDEMIISLYAGGMTVRDIQHHLVSTIGTELSHETISKITDQVPVLKTAPNECSFAGARTEGLCRPVPPGGFAAAAGAGAVSPRLVCLQEHGRPDRGPAVGTGAVRWSNRCPAALAGMHWRPRPTDAPRGSSWWGHLPPQHPHGFAHSGER
jgi:Transposase, Mutator family